MSDQPFEPEEIILQTRTPSVFGAVSFGVVALVFACAWWFSSKPTVLSLVLFVNLAALSWYDFHYFRLPNLLTGTLALTSIAMLLTVPQALLVGHMIGGLVGLMFFPLLNFFYRLLRGRSGIGLGDAKLLGGVGLWLGWLNLPFVLLTASLSALMVTSLSLMFAKGENRKQLVKNPVPFGIFLAIGAWLVWLFPQI
ncbi:MAG: prepilin peptidase [Kordiimonadaceae bacterium]|nr:prepilin peptidase [Kordiimonadaceae bacterium]MBO6568098.1 prepilin peptidase [Kordiimonadaceae bacterium]MBO6964172.1 prepilin peptidase [Kordiimonadaceae bacterium]